MLDKQPNGQRVLPKTVSWSALNFPGLSEHFTQIFRTSSLIPELDRRYFAVRTVFDISFQYFISFSEIFIGVTFAQTVNDVAEDMQYGFTWVCPRERETESVEWIMKTVQV